MDEQEDKELFNRVLGQVIRKKREAKGWTLEDLSHHSKVDDKHLGRIERGEKCPSSYTLALIQNPLDLTSDEYLNEFIKKRE